MMYLNVCRTVRDYDKYTSLTVTYDVFKSVSHITWRRLETGLTVTYDVFKL